MVLHHASHVSGYGQVLWDDVGAGRNIDASKCLEVQADASSGTHSVAPNFLISTCNLHRTQITVSSC